MNELSFVKRQGFNQRVLKGVEIGGVHQVSWSTLAYLLLFNTTGHNVHITQLDPSEVQNYQAIEFVPTLIGSVKHFIFVLLDFESQITTPREFVGIQ